MSQSFAVLHTEKGDKSGSGGIGNHIDRTPGYEHSYENADSTRSHLNKNIPLANDRHKMKLSEAINDRISEGFNEKRKIRTDAVKYLTTILTGSHDRMIEISKDPEMLKYWIEANAKFVSEEFGGKNIVRFTLHLDEKTPHIHCVHVPLTKDGRLSAKELMGGKVLLRERQDRYAKAMEGFGLERGIKNTGVKHQETRVYAAQMKKADELTRNKLRILNSTSFKELPIEKREEYLTKWLKSSYFDLEAQKLAALRTRDYQERLARKLELEKKERERTSGGKDIKVKPIEIKPTKKEGEDYEKQEENNAIYSRFIRSYFKRL